MDKGRAVGPRMGLASQGTARARALGSGQVDPLWTFPPMVRQPPWEGCLGGGFALGSLGGRTALGWGASLQSPQDPNFAIGQEAAS